MSRVVRSVALSLVVTALAACSSSPMGPANSDYVNPNIDYVNPNIDYVNPNINRSAPTAMNYVNPNI